MTFFIRPCYKTFYYRYKLRKVRASRTYYTYLCSAKQVVPSTVYQSASNSSINNSFYQWSVYMCY